jgi:hypothetical protein
MTIRDLATDLVTLCNSGQGMTAIDKYYSSGIVSIEVAEPMKELHGIEAVRAKNEWWANSHEVHSAKSVGPWVNGEHFIVEHNYDITQKESGRRLQVKEYALYTVDDGEIVQERFFYNV